MWSDIFFHFNRINIISSVQCNVMAEWSQLLVWRNREPQELVELVVLVERYYWQSGWCNVEIYYLLINLSSPLLSKLSLSWTVLWYSEAVSKAVRQPVLLLTERRQGWLVRVSRRLREGPVSVCRDLMCSM